MAIAGKNGKLCIGMSKVIGIKNWSLSLNIDTIDTTSLGEDWKSYILGLKEWTATSDGDYTISESSTENVQGSLQNAFLNGVTVIVRFYVNDTYYYAGNAIITSLSIDDPVADVIGISIGFTGCGALTFEKGESNE